MLYNTIERLCRLLYTLEHFCTLYYISVRFKMPLVRFVRFWYTFGTLLVRFWYALYAFCMLKDALECFLFAFICFKMPLYAVKEAQKL